MGLELYVGNIVDDDLLKKVNAIVNPSNPMMKMGMGVSMAIFQKAGVDELEAYTESTYNISYDDISRKNEMTETEIRIVPGFNIPCDIIFVQSPNLQYYEQNEYNIAYQKLLKTYKNVLDCCVKNKYNTILLPSLGTGHYGFKHIDTAKDVINILKSYSNKLNIIFVLYDNDIKKIYEQYMI